MMRADLMLKSNCIYSGRGRDIFSGAVAVKDGKILRVFRDGENWSEYAGPETKVYEYENHLIMPGFIDSHIHTIDSMLFYISYVDLHKAKSKQECVERVKKYYDENPDAEFIYGAGWFTKEWETVDPQTKENLDAISSEIPIYLMEESGWNCWMNSAGLAACGYSKETITEDIAEYFTMDENGDLTGLIFGGGPPFNPFFAISKEEQMDIASRLYNEMLESGITTLGELGTGRPGYELLRDTKKAGRLKQRICWYPAVAPDQDLSEQLAMKKELDEEGIDIVVKGLKGFIDGVLDGHTALMLEPYSDIPGEKGYCSYGQEEANKLVANANALGFAVRFHALGDGAVNMVLNAVEYSQNEKHNPQLRNAVEHVNFISEEDKKRLRKLGVTAAMQPSHRPVYPDTMVSMFGEDRFDSACPLQSLIDAGAAVSISTDFPVVTYDPFYTIYTALTRNNAEGTIKRINKSEIADIYSVLEGYTYWEAYTMGIEDETGTIEAGKAADIIVIDGPVVNESPEEILNRKVVLTVMNGEAAFERK